MGVSLAGLTKYLDDYLRVTEIADHPNAVNGLQVDGPPEVTKVLAAVDACQATIDAAVEQQAELLLVHHGLFWRGVEPVTGRHGRRLRALLSNGVAVYSAHIPLDIHPEVGNNPVLARQLGIEDPEPFGDYHGAQIGVVGRLELRRDQLVAAVRQILGTDPQLVPAGPAATKRVAVITGGGGSMIRDARDAGADSFVTGEGAHHTYFDAEEWGLNVLYAGHYATETVGVKALAGHLAQRFSIEWAFSDHPTGL